MDRNILKKIDRLVMDRLAYVIDRIPDNVMDRLPDYAAIHLQYFQRFKKFPNLKTPKTLNDKIAWRKLYQKNPLFPIFADKIAVKAEIAKIIGHQHIIETLWIGDNPDDIPFDDLTPPYVIKVNHSCGGNIFVHTKRDLNRPEIIESINKHLRFSHGHMLREWGYLDIPHRVLVERMIEMPKDDVPEDYKFFVYDGRVNFIQVVFNKFNSRKVNFYDPEWRLLPVELHDAPKTSRPVSRPSNLEDMIDIAQKIGSKFDFVRVDLYSNPPGILFGEVTFYPLAGFMRFVPDEWDYKFGESWKIGPTRV